MSVFSPQPSMEKYEVCKLWFFPEIGGKPPVGTVIELEKEAAEQYMHNEPGLLRPVRRTTQGSAPNQRSTRRRLPRLRKSEKTTKPKSRKRSSSKKKK